MIDELDEIMEFQKTFLTIMSDIRAKNMMTFPVSTISLIKKNGQFEDKEFATKFNSFLSASNLAFTICSKIII